jgi:hypothetical protein
MTVHAPTDIRSVTIPEHRGGCGQPHENPDLGDGEHLIIDCPACEPVLLAMKGHGYANDPLHVGLTCDERAAAEAIREKNQVAQERMVASMASPEGFAQFMRAAGIAAAVGQPAAVPPEVMEEMAAMRAQMAQLAEQNADLAAKLAERDSTPRPTKRAPRRATQPAADQPTPEEQPAPGPDAA